MELLTQDRPLQHCLTTIKDKTETVFTTTEEVDAGREKTAGSSMLIRLHVNGDKDVIIKDAGSATRLKILIHRTRRQDNSFNRT